MSNVLTTKRAVFALQTRKSINMGASNIQSEIAPGKLGAMLADGSAVVGYHADDNFASLHLGKVFFTSYRDFTAA